MIRLAGIVAITASTVLSQAPPWDSRNISADNWVCKQNDLMVSFGQQAVSCGTEVMYADAQKEPLFTVRLFVRSPPK